MIPFVVETGPGVALRIDNIDTDQLIPARFMNRSRTEGYGKQLLHDMRFDADGSEKPEFPLNQLQMPPKVLVAGENFGCGSSREAAVYALVDHGIRCVVARGFADIFRNNAQRNGLLTIVCNESDHHALITHVAARTGRPVTVDLAAQTIESRGLATISFDIDAGLKRLLMLGLDELSLTMEHIAEIESFEERYFSTCPWSRPDACAT